MDMAAARLLARATEIARDLAYDQVMALAQAIRNSPTGDWSALAQNCLAVVPQLRFRDDVRALLEVWRQAAWQVEPEAVAFLLMGAAQATKSERAAQRIELIWTGPDSTHVSLRRTEQALLETIEGAEKALLLVSFAVYVTPALSTAILAAAQRGVKIDICVESSAHENGIMAYNPVTALGPTIRAAANVYIWPLDARPKAENGKSGALHAKCAVADQAILFISSANLTGHAMNTNMELGVLIRGGPHPGQVMQHFQALIAKGVLVRG